MTSGGPAGEGLRVGRPTVGKERTYGSNEYASVELLPKVQQKQIFLSLGAYRLGKEREVRTKKPVAPHLSEFPPQELAPATVLENIIFFRTIGCRGFVGPVPPPLSMSTVREIPRQSRDYNTITRKLQSRRACRARRGPAPRDPSGPPARTPPLPATCAGKKSAPSSQRRRSLEPRCGPE